MLACFIHVTARLRRKIYPGSATAASPLFSLLITALALAEPVAAAPGREPARPAPRPAPERPAALLSPAAGAAPIAKTAPADRPSLPFKAPPGTRWLDGRYAVGSGLAEATRFVDRQLTRTGIAFARRGPYRVRGVEVTRFVSEDPSTSWLAIHLVRKEGRTFLDVVDRPSPLTNQRTP